MQLVTEGGRVLAYYDDAVIVPMAAFPASAALIPYSGEMEALGRVGPAPPAGVDDSRYHAVPQTIDLADYAALRRFYVEIGGVRVNGAVVRTDRESQGLLSGAYLRAQGKAADAVVSVKTLDGFAKLTASQVKALADAVGDHVQACFDAEEAIDAGITARTITTIAQIDAAFAPLALTPEA